MAHLVYRHVSESEALASDSQVAVPPMPLVVRCAKCRHTWIAVYLSMNVADVARVLAGICCPNCGTKAPEIGFAS